LQSGVRKVDLNERKHAQLREEKDQIRSKNGAYGKEDFSEQHIGRK
jgi:hypothetical protein